jgi:hypothetical protein
MANVAPDHQALPGAGQVIELSNIQGIIDNSDDVEPIMAQVRNFQKVSNKPKN